MAKITLNSNAPAGEGIHFSFPDGDFDLAPGESHEVDDSDAAQLLGSITVHPWLSIEPSAPVAGPVQAAQAPAAPQTLIAPATDTTTLKVTL